MFCFRAIETGESRRLNSLRTKSPEGKCLMTFENEKKVEKSFFTSWWMSEPGWGKKEKSG